MKPKIVVAKMPITPKTTLHLCSEGLALNLKNKISKKPKNQRTYLSQNTTLTPKNAYHYCSNVLGSNPKTGKNSIIYFSIRFQWKLKNQRIQYSQIATLNWIKLIIFCPFSGLNLGPLNTNLKNFRGWN